MAFSRDGGRIISTQDLAIRKPSLPGRFCGGLRSAGLMAQAGLSYHRFDVNSNIQ